MELAECDQRAAALAREYANAEPDGEFCIVIRTCNGGRDVRAIMPKVDAVKASEWLHKAAELIFRGPAG